MISMEFKRDIEILDNTPNLVWIILKPLTVAGIAAVL